MKTAKTQLTAAQTTALQQVAKYYGRTWKSALRGAWATGSYGAYMDEGPLQQIRNTFGPTWLVRFKLETLAAPGDPLAECVARAWKTPAPVPADRLLNTCECGREIEYCAVSIGADVHLDRDDYENRSQMTILELLTIANTGYPEGFLAAYYDEKTGEEREEGIGDTLAEFVVRELRETFADDGGDPLSYAVSRMETAIEDLQGVVDALEAAIARKQAK